MLNVKNYIQLADTTVKSYKYDDEYMTSQEFERESNIYYKTYKNFKML